MERRCRYCCAIPLLLSGTLSGPFEHGYGDTADADDLVPVVVDANLPDLGGLAEMDGSGDACDEAIPHPTQVIGVDLEAYTIIFTAIDHESGADAAKGLSEDHGGPPWSRP